MARNARCLSATDLARLKIIVNGPEFIALAKGNAKEAKALRNACAKVFEQIGRAVHHG